MTSLLAAVLLCSASPALADAEPTFRATASVEADLGTVLEVLLDVGRYREWDDECLESEELLRPSKGQVFWRYLGDVPWPAHDREAYLWSEVTVVTPGVKVRIDFREAAADEAPPPRDGVVRVPLLRGSWTLLAEGPSRTGVVYVAKTRAGGAVPDFIVAHVGAASPKALIKGLRKRAAASVKDGRYRDRARAWGAP